MGSRIFFACQAVGAALDGTNSFSAIHGVQSVGITTTFNLEQVFELGQLELYENIENIPDIEMSLEKVLDGYATPYLYATRNAAGTSLTARGVKKSTFALSIFEDAQDNASGTPVSQVVMSGLFTSQLTYNFPVEGNFSESMSLVGNNKFWITGTGGAYTFTNPFTGGDSPYSLTASGGVNRRENMMFTPTVSTLDANSQIADPHCTILPGNIQGITSSGTNPKQSDGSRSAHLQDVTVSTNFGREAIFEQGRKTPYFRFITFPIEVTTSIGALSTQGDLVGATEDGVISAGSNLRDYSIRIACREGLRLDLGTKNKLSSVSYGGGDTGGGNVIVSYNYSNFNIMAVAHINDITPTLRPANGGLDN
jgi:hypothetical protein